MFALKPIALSKKLLTVLCLLLHCFISLNVQKTVSLEPESKYNCPLGWTRFGQKKCLRYVNEVQDFDKAQSICRSSKNQANLVTIHSNDEQNFVFSYIHSIAASSTPIWIGAKQIDFESILWLDKNENSYTNWAPSQPSHPDEICIAINPRTGLWHDVMCGETNVPACERAPTTQWPFFVAFCAEGWFQYHDEKCIRIISSQALNFYESQELCRSKYNSKLLSIKTDHESEFVHNLIKFRDIKMPVWLGAVQNDFSSFIWLDKSDVKFTNWADGEPNDPDHACLSMSTSGNGKWSDNDCKEQKLILCQKSVSEAEGSCETGWLQFRQSKCYRFVHVRLSFDDADTLCTNLYGAHLPSIHSQEEQFMITQFLASVNVKNGSEIWLGGKQMDFQNFNWADGSAFNFSHWDAGEPSFPSEKCIEMSWRNGRWNDINCRLKRAVLCERPIGTQTIAPIADQISIHFHKQPNLYQSSSICLSNDSSQALEANSTTSTTISVACNLNNTTDNVTVPPQAINQSQQQHQQRLSPAIQQNDSLQQLFSQDHRDSVNSGRTIVVGDQTSALNVHPATIRVVSSVVNREHQLQQNEPLQAMNRDESDSIVSARSELSLAIPTQQKKVNEIAASDISAANISRPLQNKLQELFIDHSLKSKLHSDKQQNETIKFEDNLKTHSNMIFTSALHALSGAVLRNATDPAQATEALKQLQEKFTRGAPQQIVNNSLTSVAQNTTTLTLPVDSSYEKVTNTLPQTTVI